MQEQNGKDFILDHFYIILNLEVGRKSTITSSPTAFGSGGFSGQTYANPPESPCRRKFPKSMQEKISTLV
jgi:hypothetical protein